ncbi:uncharacterized protein LOC130794419 isoform X5 [Actinidia eriantha]|uniref:uncharacterized protein LOC130794419 isoform X5 n=1 Tax=Actinidia eriantha TaxID=165200 RepID=UPI00258E0527|nr:uncharacterized protein LOC130794419 isoform X5 [Actinidia eriantha]
MVTLRQDKSAGGKVDTTKILEKNFSRGKLRDGLDHHHEGQRKACKSLDVQFLDVEQSKDKGRPNKGRPIYICFGTPEITPIRECSTFRNDRFGSQFDHI